MGNCSKIPASPSAAAASDFNPLHGAFLPLKKKKKPKNQKIKKKSQKRKRKISKNWGSVHRQCLERLRFTVTAPLKN
jgi:hypothetical protein